MKILALHGSQRNKGNSATILNWVREELEAMGHKVEIEHVRPDYKGCQACYNCKKYPDEPACAVDNDIYYKMIDADAIIFATPLHCWSFSAPLKGVIDRSLCLVADFMSPKHRSLVEGKNFGLIVTSAGPIKNNTELTTTLFERYLVWIKGVNAAELLVPFCSEPENLDPGIKEKAKEFAAKMTGSH